MAEFPRYNRIQQRSVHNAYLKAEQLIDQLIFHRVRDLELDLHRWAQLGCPYTAPPDWGIYHTIGEAGTNVCKVGEALRLFSAFHRGNPSHEVVTVHLELKSRGTGEAVGVFDDYPADDLDRVLVRWLGRAHIFAPADLLAANPGSPALHDAANTGSGGGWPTVDKLRGRFIFVVHGAPELDSYATATTATGRLCFLMREDLADDDRLITANRHVVFLGEVGNPALVRIRSRFPGLILRARQADDADGFFRAQSAGANLILTDAVDVHDKPWARTHNARLYPFAAVGERGAGATQHASVRDLVEREPLHVIVTHSSDIWGTRDSCTFAQSRSFPPRSRLDRPAEDVWSAQLGSASNDTVDGWGKVLLMARDALAPGARYFAIGKAADDHGLFVQWRERDGGDTAQTQFGDYPYRVDGMDSHVDRESVTWVRLRVTDLTSTTKRFTGEASIDGVTWRRIETRDMSGSFEFRGVAACSQGSRHRDAPGVEFALQRLRRNGNPPVEFTVHRIGDANGSRFEVFAERTRRPRVQLTLTDRADSEVVLSSEDRPGGSPLCDADKRTFRWSDAVVTTTATYHAQLIDFDNPVLRWALDGTTLPAGAPTGTARLAVDGRTVAVAYRIDAAGSQLFLTSDGDDGAYAVAVTATATDAGGPTATSGSQPFSGVGRRAGFGSDYRRFLSNCLHQRLDRLRIRPQDIRRPGRPIDPTILDVDDAKFATIIGDVARREPRAAAELRQIQRELQGMPRTRLS